MEAKTKQGVSMIIRNIPPELRKRLKMLCVDEGISINAKVIELIKICVNSKRPAS